jgi:phosphoribosylaminoimidazolecarboxamide formyltransferase / IMP cyclohydrolase
LGIPVQSVESLTSYPSILGGRVKTLHPKVFGGILARREESGDIAQLTEFSIPEIDLVIVDLYPFEETVAAGGSEEEITEKIDIGGISLIRAAAKNHKDVLIVASRSQYPKVMHLFNEKGVASSMEDRKAFAAEAFHISSHYDAAIFAYLNREQGIEVFKQSIAGAQVLRYGENPHQKGIFYGDLEEIFDKLHGKELSYNNLVDIDAAVTLIREFKDTAFVIIKHTNACGIAIGADVKDAYLKALACDSVSAFGGILITNRTIDMAAATEINSLFCEVLIAPDYAPEALTLLQSKKNRVILKLKKDPNLKAQYRSLLNGVLWQESDQKAEISSDFKQATNKAATAAELKDLEFAIIAAKNLKSNTIALVKNEQLIGMGCGQTSRVDALKQAIHKATAFGFDLHGAVMASDAFFPFPDCVQIAHEAGITAIAQPGGSIKDQESIDYCNQHDVAMVLTGVRHFKH